MTLVGDEASTGAQGLNPPALRAVDIRRAAMDLLARRDHSCHELAEKLSRKFISRDTVKRETITALIEEQLAILAAENLQSDERFVESFINGRKAQGKGPMRIRQELVHKQIPGALIEQYLFEDDEQWQQLATEVYRKKFGDKPASGYQEKAKRMRFMQYRGFSPAMFSQLLG